jgi:hypothetical protein
VSAGSLELVERFHEGAIGVDLAVEGSLSAEEVRVADVRDDVCRRGVLTELDHRRTLRAGNVDGSHNRGARTERLAAGDLVLDHLRLVGRRA